MTNPPTSVAPMKRRAAACAIALLALIGAAPMPAFGQNDVSPEGAADGLKARFLLDEGAGTLLNDRGPHRNRGAIVGPTWVSDDRGAALHFNRVDHHAYCPLDPPLDYTKGLTVSVWVKPASLGRMQCLFATYGCNVYIAQNGKAEFHAMGKDGRVITWAQSRQRLVAGGWGFVVFAYDAAARTVTFYINGGKSGAKADIQLREVVRDEMLLGVIYGMSFAYDDFRNYRGLMSDLQIYERALQPEEVTQLYRAGKARLAGRLPLPERVVQVRANVSPIYRTLQADVEYDGDFPDDAAAEVDLSRAGDAKAVASARVAPLPASGFAQVAFPTEKLELGEYRIRAVIRDGQGRALAPPATAPVEFTPPPEWTKRYEGVRILNNFAAELLSRDLPEEGPHSTYEFRNPRRGWIFISIEGDLAEGQTIRLSLSDDGKDKPLIERRPEDAGPSEVMRPLDAGRHTLHLWCEAGARPARLVVRAIPELVYSKIFLSHALEGASATPDVGEPVWPTQWEFVRDHAASHVSGIVARELDPAEPAYKEWKERGGRWYTDVSTSEILGIEKHDGDLTADRIVDAWAGEETGRLAAFDGRFLSEFGVGYFDAYPLWSEAVPRLRARGGPSAKLFSPYVAHMAKFRPGRDFVRALVDTGYPVARKLYLRTPPTEPEADALLYRWYRRETIGWEQRVPGITRRTFLIPGIFNGPPEGLDEAPGVDFKVFMDKILHRAANDPALFGTCGVMWYNCRWCDEETARWGLRLLRHYCIEGRRDRLSRDPYGLPHVTNPNFAHGTEGWRLEPAADGAIKTGSLAKYYWMQKVYSREKLSDSFLIMQRNADRPNRITQTVRHLQPGRVYTLTLFAADHDDLAAGKSDRKHIPLAITIENADELVEKRACYVYSGSRWHRTKHFNAKNLAWINYHVRRFRARGDTAQLTIADWQGEQDPGGPIGQNIMLNAIRIAPYFSERE